MGIVAIKCTRAVDNLAVKDGTQGNLVGALLYGTLGSEKAVITAESSTGMEVATLGLAAGENPCLIFPSGQASPQVTAGFYLSITGVTAVLYLYIRR